MNASAPPFGDNESRPPKAPTEATAQHYARFNFLVLVGDVTFFFVGIAFLDAATVLPSLVTRLGGGPEIVGMLAALKQGGFWLPQLLVAHRLQGRTRLLPFLLSVCLWGRVWMFPAALALLVWGETVPTLALGLLIAAYGLLWIGDGAGVVPWTALIGRTIPTPKRGQFFATTQVVSGLGRIGVGLIVAYVLAGDAVPFPASGALLVLGSAVFLMVSFGFLARLREPEPDPTVAPSAPPSPALGAYVRALPAALRSRPGFGRLALAQVLAGAAAAGAPFYLLWAQSTASAPLPPGVEGRFLVVLTLGGLLCAPVWGWLTDRRGPRAALLAVFAAGVVSPAVVLAGGWAGWGTGAFAVAYFFLGGVLEGGWTVFTNYLLEMIPAPEQTTFIGLLSVLTVPVLLLPLLAGFLVKSLGAPLVLVGCGVLLLAGLCVAAGLPDPRRPGATTTSGPPTKLP